MFWKQLFQQKAKCTQPGASTTPAASLTLASTASSGGPAGAHHEFSEYGLHSPPDGPKSRNLKKTLKAIRNDGFSKFLKDPKKAKMLVFLYGRGFMAGSKDTEWRKDYIHEMITEGKSSVRLLRVLEFEGDRDVSSEQMEFYLRNCIVLRRYFRQVGACGYLDDMGDKDDSFYLNTFYFRIQMSGNCFLQAPCVMLAYLAQKHNIRNVQAAVDVAKYVRHSLSDEQLYKYVVSDSGGFSIDVLDGLLKPLVASNKTTIARISLAAVSIRQNVYDVAKHLKKYGPGLVSTFKVSKEFRCTRIPEESKGKIGYIQFDGNFKQDCRFVDLEGHEDKEFEVALEDFLEAMKPRELSSPSRRQLFSSTTDQNHASLSRQDEEEPDDSSYSPPVDHSSAQGYKSEQNHEYHAMVLIGFRIEPGSKKKWLLFQNWWEGMQLVEVSDEYFKNAEGQLVFVAEEEYNDNVDLEDFYSMNDSRVAQSSLDKPETACSFSGIDRPLGFWCP